MKNCLAFVALVTMLFTYQAIGQEISDKRELALLAKAEATLEIIDTEVKREKAYDMRDMCVQAGATQEMMVFADGMLSTSTTFQIYALSEKHEGDLDLMANKYDDAIGHYNATPVLNAVNCTQMSRFKAEIAEMEYMNLLWNLIGF